MFEVENHTLIISRKPQLVRQRNLTVVIGLNLIQVLTEDILKEIESI